MRRTGRPGKRALIWSCLRRKTLECFVAVISRATSRVRFSGPAFHISLRFLQFLVKVYRVTGWRILLDAAPGDVAGAGCSTSRAAEMAGVGMKK